MGVGSSSSMFEVKCLQGNWIPGTKESNHGLNNWRHIYILMLNRSTICFCFLYHTQTKAGKKRCEYYGWITGVTKYNTIKKVKNHRPYYSLYHTRREEERGDCMVELWHQRSTLNKHHRPLYSLYHTRREKESGVGLYSWTMATTKKNTQ